MTGIGSWIDGKNSDTVSVHSRALNYGDGVFETIRVRNGNLEFLHRHLARLKKGCERLQLNPVNWSDLENECRLRVQNQTNVIVKIILARGAGRRGYVFDRETKTDQIISLFSSSETSEHPENTGVRVRICDTRLAVQPLLAGIKHLNRLEQILARAEWSDPNILEGLMLNRDDQIIEGTMSNLFVVHGETLSTPDLSSCGVSGVLRSVVLDTVTHLDIKAQVKTLDISDLFSADEVFICNSVIGVLPVVEIVTLKSYLSGVVTKSIQDAINYNEASIESWYPR